MADDKIRTTRRTLIRRLKDPEDEHAWNEFCQFYWDMISSWARQHGCSPSMIQDVFQETMISLLRCLPSFEYQPEKGLFRSFLKTIVSRRVKDLYRRNAKYVRESDLAGSEDGGDHSILDSLQDSSDEKEREIDLIWLRNILVKALRANYKRVDSQTYKSFCLYVLDGLPVSDVCSRLGIDREGTVYQQKSRFLSMLKQEFEKILLELDPAFRTGGDNFDRMFMETFNEFIREKPEYRQTMIRNTMPAEVSQTATVIRKFLDQLASVQGDDACLVLLPEAFNESLETGDIAWHPVGAELTLGASESVAFQLEGEGISQEHAAVTETEQKTFVLSDKASTNGTYCNGEKVTDPVPLNDGDIIQIAERCLVFLDR